MSQNGPLPQRSAIVSSKAKLGWLILLAVVVLGGLGVFFAANSGTPEAVVVGDFAILLAALLAGFNCGRAGLRGGVNARAWILMSVAAYVWAAGMAVWTYFGLANNHVYPFPSLADAAFVGYSVPAAVALFSFKRPGGTTRVGLLRTVLDAAVIAGSVLVISWYTVLGPAIGSEGDVLTRLTIAAYPVVDVIMTSLVLVLGMRRQPGERLPWLCFGGGLLVLTITDSTYVRLTFDGRHGRHRFTARVGLDQRLPPDCVGTDGPVRRETASGPQGLCAGTGTAPLRADPGGFSGGRSPARTRDECFPVDCGQSHGSARPGPPGADHH